MEYVIEQGLKPIKMWTDKVPVAENAIDQLKNLAQLPFIYKHIAVMPDVHLGYGSTIGSVIPTKNAIIPSAVGVDIGCGMAAVRTNLTANDLPDNLHAIRSKIEEMVPHGKAGHNPNDLYDMHNVTNSWNNYLLDEFNSIVLKFPVLENSNTINHLGTLGGGNHFIEICLDENDDVWVMLHSGSRGVGNHIGRFFIEKAKEEMERFFIHLPDDNLAYLPQGSRYFDDYVESVGWAQKFASLNRIIMLEVVLDALEFVLGREIVTNKDAINCHHNYVELEHHFGKNVYVTRKGAVRARKGDLGIIPGSMGAKSFIVEGLGNEQSFCSCSHGAGRIMSRTEAKKAVSIDEHKASVAHVECRVDENVIDETPKAYKNIDDVMESQKDLVRIVHTLRQVVCVKG